MGIFQANFSYTPSVIFAPAKLTFTNTSTLGYPIDDDFTLAVDENGNEYTPSNDLTSYLVSRIELYEWNFDDDLISSDAAPTHIFDFSDTYSVSLAVYSPKIFDITTGIFFRIKNVITIDIVVGSLTYAWLKQHMAAPQIEAFNNQGWQDLISSTSQMFDRMYEQITEVASLMDVQHVAPMFLQYFSQTLNHQNFYAEKVGYAEQTSGSTWQSFLDYNIFNRITAGTANDAEIQTFRQFIIDTASIFKQKGSKDSIQNFFNIYDFTVQVKEMWTTNFGTTSLPPLNDNFFFDPTLENTKSKFMFKGIGVVGLDNSVCQFNTETNNLMMDNYHFLTIHSYATDAIENPNCTTSFEINDYPPNINAIQRDDGRSIVDTETCEGFDIDTPCASAEPENTCKDNGVIISPNGSWAPSNNIIAGVSYKVWNAPTGYVQSVVNTLGTIVGPDEADEPTSTGVDLYLWADWKSGVSIPSTIVGVSPLRRPNLDQTFSAINFTTTLTNDNLIQVPGVNIPTEHDFFVVARGFIEVSAEAYYDFTLDIGNTGTGDGTQGVALFSLKHTTPYTEEEVSLISTVDNFTFTRDQGDNVQTVGTTASGFYNIYSKVGEYGIIEIRQNEQTETSGSYYLTPGFYSYELKSTYSSLVDKNLQLYWYGFTVSVETTSIIVNDIVSKAIIPTYVYSTIDDSTDVIDDDQGKGLLTIPNELIEGADMITVSYAQSTANSNNVSGIISTVDPLQDFEMNIRFAPVSIPPYEEVSNRVLPQRTIMALFRAVSLGIDLYADFDTYYAVILNGNLGTLSIAQVGYSTEVDGAYFRYLNLNPNLTDKDKIQTSITLTDENNQLVVLTDDVFYDLKLVVINNTVTVFFRQNNQFTTAYNNVATTVAQDLSLFQESDTYLTAISGMNLIQDDSDTTIYDANGNELILSEQYVPITQPGAYGVAVQTSVFNINKIHITPFDKVDFNLLETEDKWKQIKPKFLDSRPKTVLQYNSYDVSGDNSNPTPTFDIQVSSSYDGTNNTFVLPTTLGTVDNNDVESLLADNVSVVNWGSRFNVLLDLDYLNERFDSVDEALANLIVPYGNIYEPFINWGRVEPVSSSYSQTSQAGYAPFINASAHVLPHTISLSGSEIQYISTLDRSTTDSTMLECNTVLQSFLNATTHSNYLGFWEEVCPLSVSPTWTVNGQTFPNKVFELIYRDTTTEDEVIGVRVLSQDVITKLSCRYCVDAIVYGLYEIVLPNYATINEPSYTSTTPPMSSIQYFVPIGKLDTNFVFFLPPPEILRNNVGTINLLGVYAQHSFEGFQLINNSQYQIQTFNPYENDYKSKIQCNYFLDLQTSFVAQFTEYNVPLNENVATPCNPGNDLERDINATVCTMPNSFYMPQEITNIFTYLETNSTNFADDYNYWVPKQMWIKRQFAVVYPDNTDLTVYGGLNVPNSFYTGTENIVDAQGTTLVLQDGFAADLGQYIVDVSWCASSAGWDAEFAIQSNNTYDVGVFSVSAYANIGFDSSTKFTMGTEQIIPLGNYLSAPIPLQTVSVSGMTNLLFGSYLVGEHGPGRTFMPVGLYNWYLTHANQVDDTMSTNQRAGWDLSAMNNDFVDCIKFNGIYGQIDSSNFSINKYWAFNPNQVPPFGSVVRIVQTNGNCAAVDGVNAPLPISNVITLGVSDGLNAFYAVPPAVEPFPMWYDNISNVYVDDYLIPDDQYTIQTNTTTNIPQLVIYNQLFDFSSFVGPTQFTLSFFADKLFNLTEKTILVDDFNQNREINWLTLVETDHYYQIATRLPDTELKYTGSTLPYNIISYENTDVYQLVDKFDYTNPSQFSGENAGEGTVGIISNDGSINVMMLTDVASTNYSISCDVIFDSAIVGTDIDKHFELILKAQNSFVRDQKQWGITDFYYVGVGAEDFDIGLGMRTIDISGNFNETFLASFGEYNVRSIKADTWYTLKATVESTKIKIYFNEKDKNPELVINYNTNLNNESISDRYLQGEFETLQAVIAGLQNLGITYPAELGNTVSSQYTFEKFKQEFAATLPIKGFYTGFRVFNSLTYVANVQYIANSPKQYQFGAAYDATPYNDIIYRITNRFGLPINPEVIKVASSLNFTVFVQINDQLFYQYKNNDPEKYQNPIITFATVDDKIVVVEKQDPGDTGLGVNNWDVGSHSLVWSLDDNTQNITSMQDFFNSVPNLIDVALTRNDITYNAGFTPGTSAISGDNVVLSLDDTITLTIAGNRNITWPLGGTLGRYNTFVRVFEEGFSKEYPIMIKDYSFYKDGLQSYMNFAGKNIKEVHINDNRLHIVFEDN